jgi:hypothetical protein
MKDLHTRVFCFSGMDTESAWIPRQAVAAWSGMEAVFSCHWEPSNHASARRGYLGPTECWGSWRPEPLRPWSREPPPPRSRDRGLDPGAPGTRCLRTLKRRRKRSCGLAWSLSTTSRA